MRRFAIALCVLIVGCSEDKAETPAVVEDSAPAVETSIDSAIEETTPADTAPVDVGVDTGPSRDEELCKTGAPRLEWKTIAPATEPRCYDTFWASGGVSPSCTFLTADDGVLRCLPRPVGKVVAAWKDDCVTDGPRLLGATLVAADRPGLAMATVQLASGRHVVKFAELSSETVWRSLVEGTDTCDSKDGTGAFPYTFSDGKAVRVQGTPMLFGNFYAGE